MSAILFTVCLSGALFLSVTSVDPTTICYYQTFTTKYFNIITEDHGTVTVDFNKELYTEVSDVTGLKIVLDFQNLRSYSFRPAEGINATCTWSILRQNHIMHKCLPPYAKPLTYVTGLYGYSGTLQVDTWEVETDEDIVNRITFSTYSRYYKVPVFLQQYGYHGTTNAYMYVNPTTSITDNTVFDLPPDCVKSPAHPSHVIVG